MPPKGKIGTKGQKQIAEENTATLAFYTYVIGGVNVVYFVITFLMFWEEFTLWSQVQIAGVLLVYCMSYKFMSSMAVAKYTDAGVVVDGGIDLNMESGMAENSKDLILLTSITQIMSLFSNYFWLLWLLAPGRAFWMLWVNILAPWFFAEAPGNTEADEKKQKKQERRMKRQSTQR